MNINSFLCKHFDDDKKGYVNIADIIIYPFRILGNFLLFIHEFAFEIFVIFALFLIIGTFSAIIQGFLPIGAVLYPEMDLLMFCISILKGWIIPGIIIAISYILYKPAKIILDVKVAKCPLKENKEDD